MTDAINSSLFHELITVCLRSSETEYGDAGNGCRVLVVGSRSVRMQMGRAGRFRVVHRRTAIRSEGRFGMNGFFCGSGLNLPSVAVKTLPVVRAEQVRRGISPSECRWIGCEALADRG